MYVNYSPKRKNVIFDGCFSTQFRTPEHCHPDQCRQTVLHLKRAASDSDFCAPSKFVHKYSLEGKSGNYE